jgi:hypothetical protein
VNRLLLGLLLFVAVPAFAQVPVPTAQDTVRANVAVARVDLRMLVTAQEAYFADHGRYAPGLDALLALFQPSRGSMIEFTVARSDGWAAKLARERLVGNCVIYVNVPEGERPKTARDGLLAEEGVPVCDSQPELQPAPAAPAVVRPPQR